jgi:hypothetical protein
MIRIFLVVEKGGSIYMRNNIVQEGDPLMKTRISCALIVTILFLASFSFAGENVPSLLGKWTTESTGGMMMNGEKQSSETHWEKNQRNLKGILEFTSQEGQFVTGTYTSSRSSEKFIGMISSNGKLLFVVDSDGMWDCKIVDNDTMEIVYRHVKPSDSVVAIALAKRQK